ncbi:hypothetical protein [Nostoc linckia]|nr:hypothetical protein [Nostoc linckia]
MTVISYLLTGHCSLSNALFSPKPCLPHSFNFLFRIYDAEILTG